MITNDRQITISAAGSRKATHWPAQTLYWSEFIDRLKVPVKSTETLAEYLRMPKSKQDDLKDVGGFVAGALSSDRRKANAVASRDVITLDMDNVPAGETQEVIRRVDGLGCAYVIYSTRKHSGDKPRLRILLLTNRSVTAEEYEPIARKLASIIGMELCDPTTFEASRLMYWPSCCADGQYVYLYGDKPHVDADGLLGMYTDWHNFNEWPQVPGAQQSHQRLAAKQGDPTAKAGVVGAFCKTYDIYKAMDTFLQGEYLLCDDGSGRYTYTGGSTTGGAVIYDEGNFLYSHHSTDPAGGKLCNAFDLVRHHKFGDQDDDAKPDTPTNKLPSYAAMCQLAVADNQVAALMSQERYNKAEDAFASPISEDTEVANWSAGMPRNSNTGAILNTVSNISVILKNDPLIKGKIAYDDFSNRGIVTGPLPWNETEGRRDWTDFDDKGLRKHIESHYGIWSPNKIEDALGLHAYSNRFNDVTAYLMGLVWDGVPRLDTIFIDYLGASDEPYTRVVTRKQMVAAVARAMTPGVKHDEVLILAGPQGAGKSTMLSTLGKGWYSDGLITFEGKEAAELIQGVWISELGELASLNKSVSEIAKQFLSRTEDMYREPFGRRTARYPRRCVFFGTSNKDEFLRDLTGDRRYWPITVMETIPTKQVFTDLPDEVDQIWAEAYVRWQLGETLHLPKDIEAVAKEKQEEKRERSSREGIIRDFIESEIPDDWIRWELDKRRLWLAGGDITGGLETVPRDRICALEVWCEALGGDIKYMKYNDTAEINGVIAKIPGWERTKNGLRFGYCGYQKGFVKE